MPARPTDDAPDLAPEAALAAGADDDRGHRLARAALTGGRVRALLLELWQRTRLDWGFVSDRLAQTFRKEGWLGAGERRFVAETLYGMIRHLRRIDAALAAGAPRGARPRDDQRLAAYLVLDGAITAADAARALPGLDWPAVAAIDERIARERDPVKRLAIAGSLPDWLAARLDADWGARAPALAAALNQRAPMTIRANRLRTSRDALADALAARGLRVRAGAHAADALVVESRTNLFALPELRAGLFEAQDEGSQLLAALLGEGPPAAAAAHGDVVVDVCAGAGGKTLALAARMGNRGRILASDPDGGKLDELRRRARRAGVTTVETHLLPDGAWPDALERRRGTVARVLVDAPCSGIGALRRNPEARWRLRESDLADFAARQRAIASRAATLLAPGGRLVYATCTLTSIENQAVVDDVARAAGLRRVPLTDVLGDERAATFASADGRDFTTTPDRHDTDGFFAAVLERPT
jgi:16S rRNA (cytosine967-C5)-methyltransferase